MISFFHSPALICCEPFLGMHADSAFHTFTVRELSHLAAEFLPGTDEVDKRTACRFVDVSLR